MRVSTFSIAAVMLGAGWLVGIWTATLMYGDHPACRPQIEKWEHQVVLPCEHWNPPTPRTVERVRAR